MSKITFSLFASVALAVSLAPAGDGLSKKSESVVKIAAKLDKSAAGKSVAIIELDVESGWHLYANPAGHEDYDGQAVTVKGAKSVEYPAGAPYVDEFKNKVKVYQGKVQIRATVEPPAAGAVELTVRVQACTDGKNSICLPPSNVKLSVK